MTTFYVTSCCKDKDDSNKEREMSPIVLYRDRTGRIDRVSVAAMKDKVEFRILSGKYGLLGAHKPQIKWYDHLLKDDEVDGLVDLVAEDLEKAGIERVVYFMGTTEGKGGKYRLPYLALIVAACFKQKIDVTVRNWERLPEVPYEGDPNAVDHYADGLNAAYDRFNSEDKDAEGKDEG